MVGMENTDKRLAALRACMDARLKAYKVRMPGVKYLDYLSDIADPDLSSTIVIEIPAYCDPELVPTVKAALANAANPGRVHFSVCLQDDDPDKLEYLGSVRNCRVRHFARKDAPGLCAARYECYQLYAGEDYVLHVDSHMRFARCWDVALIAQWHACGNQKALLSEYCPDYAGMLDEPVGSDEFIKKTGTWGKAVNASYFQDDTCKLRFRARHLFKDQRPRRGAFIGGHFLFGPAANVRAVPPDPGMYFVADEITIAARYYTHGYDVYQPNVRCVYHLFLRTDVFKDRGQEVVRFEKGSGRKAEELPRMEQLFGIAAHGIDLGEFGLGTERTLAEFERFAGISLKDRRILAFAYDGMFDVPHSMAERAVVDVEKSNKAGRMQASFPDYSAYVSAIERPDLDSRILVQIPAYCDPCLPGTLEAARVMADNPDRVRFAVCYQDDDKERLEKLYSVPGCKVVHVPKADAKGSCVARHICQGMLEDEEFVLHTDGHMRFARHWDTVLVACWQSCGDPKAILSEYPMDYADLVDEPVDSAKFTEKVRAGRVRMMCANDFMDRHCKLRVVMRGSYDGLRPRRGAFISGAFAFGPSEMDRDVRYDPDMYFVGDEMPMAVRYFTYGYNVYQPNVRCVYHLYRHVSLLKERGQEASRLEKDVAGPDGLTRHQREARRMAAFLGVSDGQAGFGPYGYGAERSFAEFEAFSGVCFRDMSIRRFAYEGCFAGSHDAKALEFVDWVALGRAGGRGFGTEEDFSLKLPPAVARDFRKACAERGTPMEIAVQKAMERFMEPDRPAGPAAAAEAGRRMARYLQDRRAGGKAAPYLDYLAGIREPDLASTILVEIPSYCDPELRKTVESALAMAANPGRVHFAVCLQDDDLGIRDYLRSVPECRVRHFAQKDAPGTCAARYECQMLYGGEDFVFHVDAHMRFARFWDVAMVDQWERCGDPKAVLSTWGLRMSADMVSLSVDSDRFTETAWMAGRAVLPYWFKEGRWDLQMVHGGRACRDHTPEPGAFICAHYVFGPGRMDREVLVDKYMDFTGDEVPMGVRYYTHGYDVYHPCVVCVHHLWIREYRQVYGVPDRTVSGDRVQVAEGLTRKQRQVRRAEKLFGLADHHDVDLGGFGLGTERTLEDFERFAGVSFRRAEILSFADQGRFGGEHAGSDLEVVDWKPRITRKYGIGQLDWLDGNRAVG